MLLLNNVNHHFDITHTQAEMVSDFGQKLKMCPSVVGRNEQLQLWRDRDAELAGSVFSRRIRKSGLCSYMLWRTHQDR